MPAVERLASPKPAHAFFTCFLKNFFDWFFPFFDFKKEVVYCRVGLWVLFYLTSQVVSIALWGGKFESQKNWLTGDVEEVGSYL